MRDAVELKRFWRFRAATRPFEGEVGDRVFDVRRIIGYRNSFLPQIRGAILTAPEGSPIVITMRVERTLVCAAHNGYLFTNWFYRVAWDWCFCLFAHTRPIAWVGFLTDTD